MSVTVVNTERKDACSERFVDSLADFQKRFYGTICCVLMLSRTSLISENSQSFSASERSKSSLCRLPISHSTKDFVGTTGLLLLDSFIYKARERVCICSTGVEATSILDKFPVLPEICLQKNLSSLVSVGKSSTRCVVEFLSFDLSSNVVQMWKYAVVMTTLPWPKRARGNW